VLLLLAVFAFWLAMTGRLAVYADFVTKPNSQVAATVGPITGGLVGGVGPIFGGKGNGN
jgi:hypothetical protein